MEVEASVDDLGALSRDPWAGFKCIYTIRRRMLADEKTTTSINLKSNLFLSISISRSNLNESSSESVFN